MKLLFDLNEKKITNKTNTLTFQICLRVKYNDLK